MTYHFGILLCLLCRFSSGENLGLEELVISVLSQNHPYHIQQAVASKLLVLNDCVSHNIILVKRVKHALMVLYGSAMIEWVSGAADSDFEMSSPVVHLAHDEFHHVHYWTVFPLLPILSRQHGQNASWFLFGTESMRIHPVEMVSLLSSFSPDQEVFLGRALRDQEATVVHHFAFHEDPTQFSYPDLSAGVLLSRAMLSSLARRYSRLSGDAVEYSIDPAHELALFVWQEGDGVSLTDPGALCVTAADGCATSQHAPPDCTAAVEPSAVHFAVKTFSQFHEDRLPVVHDTWARDARNLRYYSDVADERLGTVFVGVANTRWGHCAKTLRILQLYADLPALQWLMVADDDTLLSVPRLLELLACYSADEPLMIGERYGFHTSGGSGYTYITGGGGMVFSVEAVRRLAASCQCPGPDSPDDVQLGLCAAVTGVTLVHSPRFHQARPPDYPVELLAGTRPVSFHKYRMIDPRQVYRSWLQEEQQEARPVVDTHTEL